MQHEIECYFARRLPFRAMCHYAFVLFQHTGFEIRGLPKRFLYRTLKRLYRHTFPHRFINEGDQLVQVGCIGLNLDRGFSQPIMFAQLVGPRGQVVCFEPEPVSRRLISAYARDLGIDTLVFHPEAIGDREKTKEFFSLGDSGANAFLDLREERKLPARPAQGRVVEVRVTTLDRACEEHGYRPEFVNVTTNGAEGYTLYGMQDVLEGDVIVSMPLISSPTVKVEPWKILAEKGFEILIYNHSFANLEGKTFFCLCASRDGGIFEDWGPKGRFLFELEEGRQHMIQRLG